MNNSLKEKDNLGSVTEREKLNKNWEVKVLFSEILKNKDYHGQKVRYLITSHNQPAGMHEIL